MGDFELTIIFVYVFSFISIPLKYDGLLSWVFVRRIPRMLEKKVCLSLNIGLRFLQNGPSTGKFEQNRLRDAVLPD